MLPFTESQSVSLVVKHEVFVFNATKVPSVIPETVSKLIVAVPFSNVTTPL